ncbi:ABA4-like family protein [soil metagenome]
MTPDTAFQLANLSVLPAWLLMFVAPGSIVTRYVVYSYLYPMLLGIVYVVLLVLTLQTSSGDFGSLAGVKELFSSEWAVVLGWVHYLVFDMFVGSWELQDSRKNGISHWLVLPCLFFTLMLGPVGLLMYLLLRGVKTGQWSRAHGK